MATPVPVVSMMYFLVVSPPKTFIMVRPASLAVSIKYARGFDGWGSWRLKLSVATTSKTSNRTDTQTRNASGNPRQSEGFLEIMSHRHGRLRPHSGQGVRAFGRMLLVPVLLFRFEPDCRFSDELCDCRETPASFFRTCGRLGVCRLGDIRPAGVERRSENTSACGGRGGLRRGNARIAARKFASSPYGISESGPDGPQQCRSAQLTGMGIAC